MQKQSAVIITSVFICVVAFAQPLDPLAAYRALATSGQTSEAFNALMSLYTSENNPALKAKEALALGVLSYNSPKKEAAPEFLKQSLTLKTRLDDYAAFYLGLIARDGKNWDEAKKYFTMVQTHTPKSAKAVEADTELARLAKSQEHWPQALQLMSKLERRYRGNSEYPVILFELTEITGALKKHADQCHFATKLYSHYPSFALSKGWGADFASVKVRDLTLNCQLSTKDREKRLSQLLLSGEFDEVRAELKTWQAALKADKKTKPEDFSRIEIDNGQLALAEAKVKDAIAHFLAAQLLSPRNFTAQMFLARAYSLTDDYARAVEGYLKAFELSPHSKLGQKALFQAAFLSYQNRDYDGAEKHFQDAVKHARGKVAWDSRWHLSWIRYLKSDFEGALKDFTDLEKDRKFAKGVDLEKIIYWRAMSDLRLQKIEEARELFTQLAGLKRLGYYTGASIARLSSLPSAPLPQPAPSLSLSSSSVTTTTSPVAPGSQPSVQSTPTTQALPSASPSRTPSPLVSEPPPSVNNSGASFIAIINRKPASDLVSEPVTSNNEESLVPEKEVEKLEDERAEEDSPESLAEAPPITSLKNEALVERFERARDLIDIGFANLAQGELREIERRTTNRSYLQTLMTEYHKAGDYFRSATLADTVFQAQREKDGIEGANALWQYAFPQAYSKWVLPVSKKFDMPSSLVWGVMRGESGYREEIHSSAGAIGLMQMIPPTAKKVAKDLDISDFKSGELISPETNILFGVRYLKRLNKTMGGNLPLTIASYNAGPHRVQGWLKDFGNLDLDEFIEHIPYLETRNYVKKVLRNYLVYETLYTKKANVLSWLSKRPTIKFDGPKPLAESWEDQ